MESGITCRRLSAGDVALLKDLLHLFGVAFDDNETYQGAVPGDGYLSGLLGKDHVIVVVAMRGGEPAGGLVAYALDKIERQRSEIYIYDLAVAQPHRRAGVATVLIRELQRIGRERGASVIFVQADKEDEDIPAIRLYESLGDRQDVFHFDIPVA